MHKMLIIQFQLWSQLKIWFWSNLARKLYYKHFLIEIFEVNYQTKQTSASFGYMRETLALKKSNENIVHH